MHTDTISCSSHTPIKQFTIYLTKVTKTNKILQHTIDKTTDYIKQTFQCRSNNCFGVNENF